MTRRPTPSRRALTLVELLLASAITAMVALAVASMMTSVSAVSLADRETRSSLLRAHAAREALRAYVEPSIAAIQISPDAATIVLWIEDDISPGMANLFEIRAVRYDSAAKTIVAERVELPIGWHAAQKQQSNTIVTAAMDPLGMIAGMRAANMTRQVVLASGVSSVAWSASDAPTRNATRLRVEIELEAAEPAIEEPTRFVFAFGLPNHRSPAR